jgi:hypothetical protein
VTSLLRQRWQLIEHQGPNVRPVVLVNLARLAFLAPDIVCAILDGQQPAHLTAARLSRITHLPLDWSEQRKMVGLA